MSGPEKCPRCQWRLVGNAQFQAKGHAPGCFESNRAVPPPPRLEQVVRARRDAPETQHGREVSRRQEAMALLQEFAEWLEPDRRLVLSPARAKAYLSDPNVRERLEDNRRAVYLRAAESLL